MLKFPTMKIKIEIFKTRYTRTEKTDKGLLVSRKDYEIKYLAGVMKQLAEKAEPMSENSEALLVALRKSFKLFGVRSFEFSDKDKE